jgi:uncharacterized membrane protein YheB (UPF0754 family)
MIPACCKRRFFGLNFISNFCAIGIVLIGWLFKNSHLVAIGSYAFSGAITNSLAIHMLFERVPMVYGSGVILLRFESFKLAIKKLILEEFFSTEQIKQFFEQGVKFELSHIEYQPLLDCVDYDKIFVRLTEAITESSFGGMLNMFGGVEALSGLRDPVEEKVRLILKELAESESFQSALTQQTKNFQPEQLQEKVAVIVDGRLAELTPSMVKKMVQSIIREHLGWLVLWGAILGGLIGGVVSFLP